MNQITNSGNRSENIIAPKNVLTFLFIALIASLPILTPNFLLFGQRISLPEIIFVAASAVFAFSILRKTHKFRWHTVYWVFVLYFLAMFVSSVFSNQPYNSFLKLLSVIYLIGLAVLTFNIVNTMRIFRLVSYAWLFGTFIVVSVGAISVFLFYFDPESPFLKLTLSHYGAVPLGNYPRVLSTLYSSSMLCNYLVVSFAILFICERLKWINDIIFHILYFLMLLTVLFTISSGLGGIALLIGFWVWLIFKYKNPVSSKLSLAGGVFLAILVYVAIFFSFTSYEQATFEYAVPFLDVSIYPSSRYLVWEAAIQTFLENPITGVGIGLFSCSVYFTNTDGFTSILTDAHNSFLSIASRAGLIGLAAFVLLIWNVFRCMFPIRESDQNVRVIKAALSMAFLIAFVYQGFFGSFEDARHLWVLIGLIMAFSEGIENQRSGEINL